VTKEFVLLWRSGADVESLVRSMREKGFNQAQSTEALTSVTGLDPIKAQIAVIYSETWRDQYQQNVHLNEQFFQALAQFGEEPADAVKTQTELDESFDPEIILHSSILS
jgi:hypothetical protein